MKTATLTWKTPSWFFIPALLISFSFLSFCSNEKRKQSVNEFKAWVKEHKDSVNNYIDREWDELEREFAEKKAELDKNQNQMDREMKTTFNEAVNEWEEFKRDYSARREERTVHDRTNQLSKTLLPDNIHEDLSNVAPSNIAIVYEHFVNTVATNKDIYSAEEWKMIENKWEMLNDIEDRMSDNNTIADEDSRKITRLKLEYTGIKALNRPFAKKERS